MQGHTHSVGQCFVELQWLLFIPKGNTWFVTHYSFNLSSCLKIEASELLGFAPSSSESKILI